MPTRNQQLVDAQVQRQRDLVPRALATAAALIALLDESEPELRVVIERYLAVLQRPGVDLSSAAVQEQLVAMRTAIFTVRSRHFNAVVSNMNVAMDDLSVETWDDVTSLYAEHGITLERPGDEHLEEIRQTAYLGRDAETWLRDLETADANRISDAVVIGLIRAEPRATILRAVLGDEGLDGQNGATQVTRNSLRSVVDSAVFSTASQAKKDISELNAEVIPRELYVAVLDSRTTPICRSLNGKVFPVGEGPYPPIHFNCRSTRVPLPLDGEVPELP